MKLCDKIRIHRRKMGLSQEELALRLGVSRQAVSKWELGTAMPDPGNIVALAKLFGISTDELLMEEPARQETRQSDFMEKTEHLPGFLRKIVRKYGWLAGVYTMISGAAFLVLGLLSRSVCHSMFESLPSAFTAQIFTDSPFMTICNAIIVLGAVVLLAGVVLTIYLYRRRRL